MQSIKELYKIGKGPSSSHTMGPERASRLFQKETPNADHYRVILYGSLSKTGKGHGTDRVIHEVFSPVSTEIVFSQEPLPASMHPNTMDFFAFREDKQIATLRVESIGGGDIQIVDRPGLTPPEVYPENSFAEIMQFCRLRGIRLHEYVEINEGPEIWDFLAEIWSAMKKSIERGLSKTGILPGGLNVERRAKLLYEQEAPHESPQVRECRIVCSYAFAVSEENADCGTIVTAPTCGSCGILPSVLRYVQEQHGYSEERILHALAVAGIIGNLIKRNASVSGAECGCQAEVGSACSMAAGALCELQNLPIDNIQYAAEIALEHHLGLTCDPICGLVQVPCIERNAVAAMRAFSACNLAFFLTDTQRISFDMVVKTMYETGIHISSAFRETSEGGLAKLYNRKSR